MGGGAVGLILVGAGFAVFAAASRAWAGDDVGWSTYAPLEPGDPAPYQSELILSSDGWAVMWTTQHVLGAGLLVLGLLSLAGLGGWLLGVRRGRPGDA